MTATIGPTTTIGDLRDDIRFRHRDDYTRSHLTIRQGNFGDTLLRCESCRAERVVTPQMLLTTDTMMREPPEPPRPETRNPRPSGLVSTWRCGHHPNQPVNWRGRGCPLCQKGNPS